MKLDMKPLVRFLEHLPKNGDTELCILKCHLLIEELLEKIIVNAATNESYVRKAKLSFAQKSHIARAFSTMEQKTWLWGAIKKLNDTRNELAHGLSQEETTKLCDAFVSLVENEVHKPEEKHLSQNFQRFTWAAFAVYSQLSAYANFDPVSLKIPTLLTRPSNQSPENDA